MTGFVSQGRLRALAVIATLIVCLSLSGIAMALKPRAGSYSGHTSQGMTFAFTLKVNKSRTRVSRLVVDLRMKCNVPGNAGKDDYHLGAPGFSVAKIKHGRFFYSEDGLVIKGHFTGKTKAEGTVRRHVRYSDPDGTRIACDSRRRSWSIVHD